MDADVDSLHVQLAKFIAFSGLQLYRDLKVLCIWIISLVINSSQYLSRIFICQ